MTYTTRIINAQGLAEIRAILSKNHKLGGEHFTDSMIHAWASEAEFQLAEGNPACIEIKSSDHISGRTEEFRLSDAAIDVKTVGNDDESTKETPIAPVKTIEITGLGSVEITTELDEVVFCSALTIKGDPANCINKKVSRSKKKAQQTQGVFLKEIKPGYFMLSKDSQPCALILHEQAPGITLSEQEKREKLVANLKENQEFIDAAEGVKLLYEFHGFEMLTVAAENEVRRAFYALNLEAFALDLKRSHKNWSDDIKKFTNGNFLRQLMSAAGIVGDWFFVPMLQICGYESFEKYHYDTN